MSPKRLPGLWRRGGVYQYRVRVPVDLIGVFGTARINRTLKTASYREGLTKARMVALDLENRFQFARDAGTLPSESMQLTGKVSPPVIPRASFEVTLSDAWQRYLSDPASMRDNWLSNRVFTSHENIIDYCCKAWNKLIDQPWRIMTIGNRQSANGS